MTNVGTIVNFSASFKFKQKITRKTTDGGTKDVEIIVPLKYLSNFWRTSKIPLISCENNLILIWSNKCFLSNDTKGTTFAITNTIVTLSTQDNAKLLQQLKSGFGKNINQKYQYKTPNPFLDYLIDTSF